MGTVGAVGMGVIVVGAAVASLCVAAVEREARRLAAATRRLAEATAGIPVPEGSR